MNEKTARTESLSDPIITVVISSYNRAAQLALALQGLTRQTAPRQHFCVLVVDNNSQDDSEQVVQRFADNLAIAFVNEPQQGVGYVRNTGFRLAQGAYVAFLDDDAIPHPDYLERILDDIERDQADCFCGPILPYYDHPKPSWFKDSYEARQLYEDKRIMPAGTYWLGSNMVWKRSVLEALGGFSEGLGMKGNTLAGGEDTDLFHRYWQLKPEGKMIYDPDAIVYHRVPAYKMKVSYMLKRNVAAGIANVRMHEKPGILRRLWLVLRLVVEMILILAVSPFLFLKHGNIKHWLVEELNRVAVRLGRLAELLGITIELTSV